MTKVTTALTAQERVILFCTATGVSHAAVGIPAHAMQSMAIKDSSSTIARAGPMRLRTADALRPCDPRGCGADIDRAARREQP
jgi:hypothetical protein